MSDIEGLIETLARELARVAQFGRQSREHLSRERSSGSTYHEEQTKLAWPDHDESVEWSYDADYGTTPGRNHYRRAAEGLIEGLDILGLHIVPKATP